MKKALVILFSFGLYIFFVGKILGVYVADLYQTQSRVYLEDNQTAEALKASNKAISYNRYEPAYLRQKVKVLLAQKIVADSARVDIEDKILKDLIKARELNPKNLATLRNSIPLYYFWVGNASLDRENPEYHEEKISSARTQYEVLKNTYNNDLGMIVDIAKYEKKLEMAEDYSVSYELAKGLRPDIVDWYEVFINAP